MMTAYPRTFTAVQNLLSELRCDACCQHLKRPSALAGCEHLLCGRCTAALASACPVCRIPCQPKDVRPQQNLHDLTFASLTFSRLLSGQETPTKHRSSVNDSFGAVTSRPCKRNARGETPLHVAAARGALGRVEELIGAGLDINAADNAGWTALHEAVNRGHAGVAAALLEAGAFPNALGGDQETPLHDAVANRREECVRLLVRRGADVLAVNADGLTPRQLAAGCPSLIDALQTPAEVAPAPHVSPVPFQPPPVFLVTGLDRKEKMLVHKVATMLRAELASDMCPRVTHLICRVSPGGTCARTLKYLHALLLGCWVVDFEWAQTCLNLKQRVTEEPFEVAGCSVRPSSLAARRGRENAARGRPGLFSGCNFHFEGPFVYPTPSRDELAALVRQGGGEVLSQKPKEENAKFLSCPDQAEGSLRACAAFFVREVRGGAEEAVLAGPFCSIRPVWIMNCCAEFRLLEPPQL